MASLINKRLLWIIFFILVLTMFCPFTSGKIIYVDDDTAGTNDGTSWENAYIYLQDALADAETADKPVEILVAGGTYTPDKGAEQTPGDRMATFQLINGVTLSGGYAGAADPNARDIDLYETILSGDLRGNDEEVVSPEDLRGDPTRADNSYNVLIGSGTDMTTVLDGFIITGGNANGINENERRCKYGGGMYNNNGSPILTNCTFRRNFACWGCGGMYNENNSNPVLNNCEFQDNRNGGMENSNGNPVLTNCTFSGNWDCGLKNYGNPTLTNCTFSGNLGSGMINNGGNPTLTNCVFSGNSAGFEGGGMSNRFGDPNLINCVFIDNTAENGGAVSNSLSKPKLVNCKFIENKALEVGGMKNIWSNPILTNCTFNTNSADTGGGMYNESNDMILTGCIFIGNSANSFGGGVFNYYIDPTLTNCLFAGNSAEISGGGMFNSEFSFVNIINCTFSGNSAKLDSGGLSNDLSSALIMNCIFWGNTAGNGPQISLHNNSAVSMGYNNLQGGQTDIYKHPVGIVIWGDGNINVDPLFVEPGYWADVNDPNIIVEPDDPNAVWVHGDYHLKSQAGRYDPNSGDWVIDDVTSPCIDAGNPDTLVGYLETPVGDEPSPNGGIMNMGAYGGTAEASKSP